MKKTITILAMVLILCSCIFASNRLSFSLNPYSFQSFVLKAEDSQSVINSKAGIGCGIGYDWESKKGFSLGADIKFATYLLDENPNFSDLTILAKLNYIFLVDKTVSLYGNVKAGVDIQFNQNETSPVFECGPELGLKFQLNKKVDLSVSYEMLLGLLERETSKIVVFRMSPAIGVGYSF